MKKALFFFAASLFVVSSLTVSAQTALTRQASFNETPAAVTYTTVDSLNGNKVANYDGKTILQIKNARSSGTVTVTVVVQNPNFTHPIFGKVTKSSISFTVAAGATSQVGPLPTAVYNDANGYLRLTYNLQTNIKAASFATP